MALQSNREGCRLLEMQLFQVNGYALYDVGNCGLQLLTTVVERDLVLRVRVYHPLIGHELDLGGQVRCPAFTV
jgi:hypothetical protein